MHSPVPKPFVELCPVEPRRVDLGGFTMNVVEAGRGRPIVFIHGLGWDHTLWCRQVSRMRDRYRVIAADTRGHGASDKPEGPYSVEQFAADWIALLEALDVSQALLVGFSLGGMIAQIIAVERPDLVGALLLVNTTCKVPAVGREHMDARFAAMRAGGGVAAAEVAARSVFSAQWRTDHPDEVAGFVVWRTGHDQAALIEVMRAVSHFDISGQVPGIAVPTTLVTSTGDEMMPPEAQAPIAVLIPNAQHIAIEDAGHMVSIEQPLAFDSIVDEFVKSRWSP